MKSKLVQHQKISISSSLPNSWSKEKKTYNHLSRDGRCLITYSVCFTIKSSCPSQLGTKGDFLNLIRVLWPTLVGMWARMYALSFCNHIFNSKILKISVLTVWKRQNCRYWETNQRLPKPRRWGGTFVHKRHKQFAGRWWKCPTSGLWRWVYHPSGCQNS